MPIRQDFKLARLIGGAGRIYAYRTNPQHGVYLFVLEGAAEIGETRLGRRDSMGLTRLEELAISLRADGTDVLLLDTAL